MEEKLSLRSQRILDRPRSFRSRVLRFYDLRHTPRASGGSSRLNGTKIRRKAAIEIIKTPGSFQELSGSRLKVLGLKTYPKSSGRIGRLTIEPQRGYCYTSLRSSSSSRQLTGRERKEKLPAVEITKKRLQVSDLFPALVRRWITTLSNRIQVYISENKLWLIQSYSSFTNSITYTYKKA